MLPNYELLPPLNIDIGDGSKDTDSLLSLSVRFLAVRLPFLTLRTSWP